jgi:hypothetical protein
MKKKRKRRGKNARQKAENAEETKGRNYQRKEIPKICSYDDEEE